MIYAYGLKGFLIQDAVPRGLGDPDEYGFKGFLRKFPKLESMCHNPGSPSYPPITTTLRIYLLLGFDAMHADINVQSGFDTSVSLGNTILMHNLYK